MQAPEQRAREAVRQAWREGRLRYKLKSHQRPAYDAFKARITDPAAIRAFALQWPRRVGKTFTAETVGVETCCIIPGARGVVVAPTEDILEEFIIPTINAIGADAPPGHQPEWKASESKFLFPNGSQIALYGAKDDNAIDVISRGPAAHFVIYEEAGHIRNLRKLREAVSPQLLSTMALYHSGWELFVGTPPESTAHEFVKICRAYARTGQLSKLTIWDAHYPREQILKFIAQQADGQPVEEFMLSDSFRREFLAEFVSDPVRKVLKHASDKNLEECQRRYEALAKRGRPSHYGVWEAMDVGWSPDWTFWLLGWWHFAEQTLVVEKELFWREGCRPEELAVQVKAAEEELLGPGRSAPFLEGMRSPSRWSDYSPILLGELAGKHGLEFAHTAKDDRDTAISNCDAMVRGSLAHGKLAINPAGCPQLLQQMAAAVWGKGSRRNEFARDDMRRYGHYDGVAALVYLTRNVVKGENPVPAGWGLGGPGRFQVEQQLPATEEEKWAKVFGVSQEDEAA